VFDLAGKLGDGLDSTSSASTIVSPDDGRLTGVVYWRVVWYRDEVNSSSPGMLAVPATRRVSRKRLPGGGELGLYEPRHPRATEL
jgi:hypothetical protein